MNGSSRLGLLAALSLLIMGILIEHSNAAHRPTRTTHGRHTRDDEEDTSCLSTILNKTNCSTTEMDAGDIKLLVFTAIFNSSEMLVEKINKSLLLEACTNLSSYCESQQPYHPICQLTGYQQLMNHAESIRIKLHLSDDESEDSSDSDYDDEVKFCTAGFNISRLNTKGEL